MTDNFFSPIEIDGPYFNGCDLFVAKQPPCSEMQIELSIDIPENQRYELADGALSLDHEMTVSVRLTGSDKDGNKAEGMHATVSMNGTVSLPCTGAQNRDTLESVLLLNAISLFYSSARSYIEFVTGQSPMRRFTIPPIDPMNYMEMSGHGPR